jgi:signal transduction histidine kinase
MTGPLGFPPTLELLGRLDDDVPHDVGDHLLGALREALSNAARHSGASKVGVQVSAQGELSLIVRDNGSGIKPGGRRSGLRNLEQRAVELGGTFRLAPAPGGGTELDWRVPLTTGEYS